MKKSLFNNCPLCKSTDISKQFSVTTAEASEYFLMSKGCESINMLSNLLCELWEDDHATICKCGSCGFRFAKPFVAGTEEFYSMAYAQSKYPSMRWEFKVAADFIRKENSSDIYALEIGAGTGAFQDYLRANNLVFKCKCTEYSRYGIKELILKGHDGVLGDFRSLFSENDNGSFNYIFAFQVLEHIDDLDAFFQKINSLLKVGGCAFLSVPNQESIHFNEQNNATIDMPPNHVGCWNKACFQVASELHGFKLKAFFEEEHRLFPALKRFSHLRFLHRAAKRKIICRNIEQLRPGFLRDAAKRTAISLLAIRSLPKFIFNKNARCGNHILAVLQKF